MEMVSPNGTYRPQLGQSIGVYLDGNIYGGTVDEINETNIGNGAGRLFQLACVSWEQRYDKRFVTKTYKDTNCGAVFADLIAITGEINNPSPNIQDGAAIDLLVLDAAQVSSVFSDLAKRSGYIWGITSEQSAFFVPRSTYAAPGPLDSSNILRGGNSQWYPNIRSTREQLQNAEVRRIARTALNPEVETFTGDGSNRTFNTAHDIALIPENGIKVNGTPVEFGPHTDTEIAWRVTYGTTLFTQREDGTPLTGSDTLEITYFKVGGDLIIHIDHTAVGAQQAIEGSGSGRYEKYVDDTDNSNAPGALAAAQANVEAFKVAPVEITLRTHDHGYLPGQIVGIALPSPHSAFTGEYLINEVVLTHQAGDGSGTDDYCLYEIKAISTTYLGGWREFWRELTGQGGGAPISATITGSGSTPDPTAPGDATLTAIDILGYHTDGPEGGTQHRSRRDATYIRLGLRGTLPDGATGVRIRGEEPDTSGSALTRGVAGSVVAGSGVVASGPLQTRDYGRHDFNASSPYLAVWSVRAPVELATYRYYADSYSAQVENAFVPANQAGASPSLTVSVSPEPSYTKGEEYAPNALNFSVTLRRERQANVWVYWFETAWTNPTTHPRWDALASYTLVFEYEDGTYGYQPLERDRESFETDQWEIADGKSVIDVWLQSIGLAGPNSIVANVTPHQRVTVERPVESAGQEYASLVVGLEASITTSETLDGVKHYTLHFDWIPRQPEDIGQVHVWAYHALDDSWHEIGVFDREDVGPHDNGPHLLSGDVNVSIVAFSISRDGLENTYVDGVTPRVSGLTAGQGGASLKATRLTLYRATEFEIVGGEFRVKNVDFSKAMPGTFDSTTFDTSGGLWKIANSGVKETHIQAGAVTTLKLTTNAIDVGGGGGKPIQFRVFSELGGLIGWIGHDTASGFAGAWFQRCLIGGTTPATAKIIADANGNVAISGNVIVGAVAQATTAGSANSANTATTAFNYGGVIQCSQLVAGTMTATGPNSGISVSYGSYVLNLYPSAVNVFSGLAGAALTGNPTGGGLVMYNSSGVNTLQLQGGGSGSVTCTGTGLFYGQVRSNSGFNANGLNGYTGNISYKKTDGVSNGIITVAGGIITNVS